MYTIKTTNLSCISYDSSFFLLDLKFINKVQDNMELRSINRPFIFLNALQFICGDILIVFFWVKGFLYRFEGICIALRKKKFKEPDVCIMLRNIILGVGVEVTLSYYLNRIFFLKISDFKRKFFLYKKSKLYYIRIQLNRSSGLKSSYFIYEA